MKYTKIYRLEERLRALREDFEDLRNLYNSTEAEELKADYEHEMNRIQDLIKEYTIELIKLRKEENKEAQI